MLEGNYYVTVHRTHSEKRKNKSVFRMLLSISLPLLINVYPTENIFTTVSLLNEQEKA